MVEVDSVADVNARKKMRPKLPSIKNLLILLVVAFGVTQDRVQTLLISLIYFVLLSLFA